MKCNICGNECEEEKELNENGIVEFRYWCSFCKEYRSFEDARVMAIEEEEKAKGVLTDLDIVDLKEYPIPEPKYLVDKIIIENDLHLCASPPKSYKTFLNILLGICIAMKWNFLNFQVNEQRNVGYFDCESKPNLSKKRIIQIENGLGKKYDRDKFHYFWKNYDLNSSEDLEKIRAKIKQYNLKVLFFDVIRGFLKDIRENSADEIREWFINRLKPLMEEFDLTVVLITHTKKSQVGDNILEIRDKIRGSSEWVNFSAILYILDRKGFENYAEFRVIGNRYEQELDPFGIEFNFDDQNASLSLNMVDREIWLKSKTTSYVKPMWEWILEREQETFTTKEFKEQLKKLGIEKGRDMVAKRVLDDLINMGKIKKVGRGIYQRMVEQQTTL